MGWWKIESVETGRIHPTAETASKFRNAIPGEEDTTCDFGGDRPADIMGEALRQVSKEYEQAWGRPAKKEELLA